MPLSKVTASYEDCRQIFEQALDLNGARVELESEGGARNLRHRMNAYRASVRRQSMKVYPVDDPEYGASPYDQFVLRVDGATLLVELSSAERYVIKPL